MQQLRGQRKAGQLRAEKTYKGRIGVGKPNKDLPKDRNTLSDSNLRRSSEAGDFSRVPESGFGRHVAQETGGAVRKLDEVRSVKNGDFECRRNLEKSIGISEAVDNLPNADADAVRGTSKPGEKTKLDRESSSRDLRVIQRVGRSGGLSKALDNAAYKGVDVIVDTSRSTAGETSKPQVRRTLDHQDHVSGMPYVGIGRTNGMNNDAYIRNLRNNSICETAVLGRHSTLNGVNSEHDLISSIRKPVTIPTESEGVARTERDVNVLSSSGKGARDSRPATSEKEDDKDSGNSRPQSSLVSDRRKSRMNNQKLGSRDSTEDTVRNDNGLTMYSHTTKAPGFDRQDNYSLGAMNNAGKLGGKDYLKSKKELKAVNSRKIASNPQGFDINRATTKFNEKSLRDKSCLGIGRRNFDESESSNDGAGYPGVKNDKVTKRSRGVTGYRRGLEVEYKMKGKRTVGGKKGTQDIQSGSSDSSLHRKIESTEASKSILISL